MESAMRALQGSKPPAQESCGKEPDTRRSKCARIVEADKSTRKRLEKTLSKDHDDRIEGGIQILGGRLSFMILAVPQIQFIVSERSSCLGVARGAFAWILWEMATCFFLVFSFAWCDSGYMFCVAWCGSTAPLYLVVTCLMLASLEEYNTWTLLGMTSRWMPYSALYLVRQWIHVSVSLRRRVSCAGGLSEMTSGLSPYSALSLVRQRIHALRQSTELFEEAHIFST